MLRGRNLNNALVHKKKPIAEEVFKVAIKGYSVLHYHNTGTLLSVVCITKEGGGGDVLEPVIVSRNDIKFK